MPLISVIIPVYNGEATIRETVESVLNQSISDWELIVINDGSKDSTLDILSSIKDSRLQIYSYSNAGLAASRNRGIQLATGEYISFLDADDIWTKDKLEVQYQALQENPQAAVAYSWTQCIDESGNFSRRGSEIIVNGDVYAYFLLSNFLDNGSNPLIRRQALIAVGNFDESLKAAEDWDIWLRLASRYHFVAVPLPQILYRVSESSMSSKIQQQEEASLKVISRAFSQAPESLQYLKTYSLANLYKYLTFKALESSPEQQQAWIAARCFWYAVKNDPSLLQTGVLGKVLLKITIIALLPSYPARALLKKAKKLANTSTLLGYLQLEPLSIRETLGS